MQHSELDSVDAMTSAPELPVCQELGLQAGTLPYRADPATIRRYQRSPEREEVHLIVPETQPQFTCCPTRTGPHSSKLNERENQDTLGTNQTARLHGQ